MPNDLNISHLVPMQAHETSSAIPLERFCPVLRPLMVRPKFHGIWVPLITPFREGRIDVPALQALVVDMVASGIHGFVACGTTGEAALLSEREQILVLTVILEAAGPNFPVIMGMSGSDTLTVVKKVMCFNNYPIAGILISAPPYIRPSQRGIHLHFQAIADASAHPLLLYNIPGRTGVNIDIESIVKLSAHPRIMGIKESSGNIQQLMDTINQSGLQVLSGDDTLFLQTLTSGGVGAISASAHIRPDLYVKIYRLFQAGEFESARQAFNQLLPLIRLLFTEPNPAPIKAILAMQGRISEELRLPMTPVSDAHKYHLKQALDSLSNHSVTCNHMGIEPGF